MTDVREVLRLAVSHAGPECVVEMHKFSSNDRWHVTPRECRVIAELLDGVKADHLVSEYLSYVDGAPDGLLGEVRALAEFSAGAADRGGFHVA
ncbi:hypothetical protein [Actinocorallia aurea]